MAAKFVHDLPHGYSVRIYPDGVPRASVWLVAPSGRPIGVWDAPGRATDVAAGRALGARCALVAARHKLLTNGGGA